MTTWKKRIAKKLSIKAVSTMCLSRLKRTNFVKFKEQQCEGDKVQRTHPCSHVCNCAPELDKPSFVYLIEQPFSKPQSASPPPPFSHLASPALRLLYPCCQGPGRPRVVRVRYIERHTTRGIWKEHMARTWKLYNPLVSGDSATGRLPPSLSFRDHA